jgi:4-carboxymuconolactone decarboxylase
MALEAGLNEAVADAIAKRQRPQFENQDEEVLYDFSTELIETKTVSDRTYAAALAEFGEKTVVELIAILGYYTSVAMVLNSFQELPADGSMPLND